MAEEQKKVGMARRVARRWIGRVARAEYRLHVLCGAASPKNLPNLLKSFRDGKVPLTGVPVISDLGIKEDFDSIDIWTTNREALIALNQWLEAKGCETSGVW